MIQVRSSELFGPRDDARYGTRQSVPVSGARDEKREHVDKSGSSTLVQHLFLTTSLFLQAMAGLEK